jgi:hypothetical protein
MIIRVIINGCMRFVYTNSMKNFCDNLITLSIKCMNLCPLTNDFFNAHGIQLQDGTNCKY